MDILRFGTKLLQLQVMNSGETIGVVLLVTLRVPSAKDIL